jgi:hypothetical protein
VIFAVDACVNSTANNNSCVSPDEYIRVMKKVQMTVATMISYFDENEFENSPIKYDLITSKYNTFIAGANV